MHSNDFDGYAIRIQGTVINLFTYRNSRKKKIMKLPTVIFDEG